MRALNAFVGDVYGERRIVSEGILPQRVLDSAEHLESALNGFSPPDGVWIGLAGLDIVRNDEGRWLVLEDNVRTPSGLAYWVAAREATLARLSLPDRACPRPLDELITTALRRTFGPGHVVVLTDGEENSAYWEHRWIAERLEVPLVELADLTVRDARIWHEGERVDGIYRRTNADRLDTAVGELLQPVLVAGGVKLVNCFGTGVADDKLAHAYVPDMIRFYLDEEPAIDQVETFDLGEAKNLERALDSFEELVIKDRGSYGGMGVVVLPARRARRRGGAPRARARDARGFHRPAAGRPLDASDRDRRNARPAPRRPATLCVDAGPRRRHRAARWDHPRRARRGRAGGQLVAERRREGHVGAGMTSLPEWADWNPAGAESPWTLGAEEEVMLLDPTDWSLASRIDDVLPVLSRNVADHAAAETHGSALELFTRPHATVARAAGELADLRAGLAADLQPLGLRAAVAGTHAFAQWRDIEVSPGARYQSIYDTMRELARREPTFALHVHVAVPDPESALRALRGLRVHVPLLLALAANSPFWQGRDTGLASTRVPVFGAFPRVGIPRAFGSYAEYVEAVDVMLRCSAFPEATFLWWDVRLQPKLGTIEVRIMDAQTRAADNEELLALVQSLVRLEATEGFASEQISRRPELLDENRFLATRDGMRAEFLDPEAETRRPVRDILDEVLEACAPHAALLGCESELSSVPLLADEPGYARQRVLAGVRQGDQIGSALGALVCALATEFSLPRSSPAPVA